VIPGVTASTPRERGTCALSTARLPRAVASHPRASWFLSVRPGSRLDRVFAGEMARLFTVPASTLAAGASWQFASDKVASGLV
jgi:endonuclease/exonuclease/phosphatase family metal-dependent hydrolase